MLVAASVGTDLFRAVLQGTPPGSVYALIALGFVLAYKTSGVFNLAFGAQAYVSAVVYFKTHVEWGWDILPSVVLSVVVLAPLLGIALELLIFRHLRTAPAVSKLVVTIGLAVALPAIVDLVMGFEAVAGVTPEGVVPDGASVYYDPFGVYAFSRNEIVAMGVGLVAMIALGALFTYSAIGLQMRAVVESPRMTELNGVASDRVSAVAWGLSSLFAGTAGVLIAPRFNTLAASDFLDLVVVGVTAAAIGRLVSLPRALLGGLGLGIFIAVFTTFMPRWAEDWPWLRPLQDTITPAIPFVVLFGALVLVPSLRLAREDRDPLAGVDPPLTPAAAATGGRGASRISRGVGILAVAAIGAVVFTSADASWTFLITQAVVLAIVFLSITVITGLAGQISLCQGAFAAIGAFTVYQLAERYEMSVIAAALVGAVIAAAVGALLALPTKRLSGIWVAIATLAFAFFFDAVLVRLSWVGGGDSTFTGTKVPRPVIGPWDFESDKAFLALAVAALAISGVAVIQVRSGTVGQTFRALRGSDVAAQAIGISPGRARVVAFALSAFIAALGGALLAIHQGNVNYEANFSPFGAFFWLVLVVTLGVRTVEGAIVAAGAFALFSPVVLHGELFGWILRSPDRIPGIFPLSPSWQFVLFGLSAIQFARHPEGLIEAGKHRPGLLAWWRNRGRDQPEVRSLSARARVLGSRLEEPVR